MNGRLENKMKVEQYIQNKISDAPDYVRRFYFSINLKSHNTKKKYIDHVLRFLNYYGNGKEISLGQLDHIDAYEIQKYVSDVSYYERNGDVYELSETAKANMLSALSMFFRFLYGNRYISRNPFEGDIIDRPKPQEKEIIYLTSDEVKIVKKAIFDGVGSGRAVARQEKWKYRDFCLFYLPTVSGIRVGALSEINIEDIDLADKSITVIEKGNVPTRIFFDDTAALYLRKWMEQRKKILDGVECDALFISNRKTRMVVKSIENTIEKYTEGSISRHISPHKLRATFATNLYGKTRDIELTSKALHHKSTAPTQKYVKVFDQDIRNAINIGLYN